MKKTNLTVLSAFTAGFLLVVGAMVASAQAPSSKSDIRPSLLLNSTSATTSNTTSNNTAR